MILAVALLGVTTADEQDDSLGRFLDAAPEAQDPAEVLTAAPTDADTSTVPVLDRVLLVGDSVMGQAYEAFRDSFDAAGITTGYAGGPGSGPTATGRRSATATPSGPVPTPPPAISEAPTELVRRSVAASPPLLWVSSRTSSE